MDGENGTLAPGKSSELVDEQSFAGRFKLALGSESPHAFSRRSGISGTMVRKYLDGSMPGLDNLLVIADSTGVTLDWLAAAKGPMRQSQPPAIIPPGMPASDYVPVPMLDIRPSAGPGTLSVYEESEAEFYGIRENFLRRLGVNPSNARLMMQPF